MKQIFLLSILLVGHLAAAAARIQPVGVSGSVVDEKGAAVGYATVVLTRDGLQIDGTITDADGRFSLKAEPGEYRLTAQFIGYRSSSQTLRLTETTRLPPIRLQTAAEQIDAVVVTGQLIRREADRFVVDVANAPSAIGKDGIELLESAPGIWIDGEKITINGKSGSKVYINDRELKMEAEQLLTYLRSLRAEEIQKIEVVPIVGAEYDASTSGGAIHITLKRQRQNGTVGSLAMNTLHAYRTYSYDPSGNISVHAGKWDLSLRSSFSFDKDHYTGSEQTRYAAKNDLLEANSRQNAQSSLTNNRLSAYCQITPKHALGGEVYYYYQDGESANDTRSDLLAENGGRRTESVYGTRSYNSTFAATLNYLWTLDTLGSKVKVIADYNDRKNHSNHDNASRIALPAGEHDSLFRNRLRARYRILTASVAVEKRFSNSWSIQAGAKFSRNRMDNSDFNEYRLTGGWQVNTPRNYDIDYTERITAGYGILSGKAGRFGFVAGLRGEYTHATGRGINQHYFSLFPNANLSCALTKDGAYSLAAQYARRISRPSFWALSPQREQISDYAYSIGNPDLRPAYQQEISLTIVLKHKYTLTAGYTLETDAIQETVQSDPEDPNIICSTRINYDRTNNTYLSASLPFQPTKWWQINLNGFYSYYEMRTAAEQPLFGQHLVQANLSTTFTLPAKCYIDLSYAYQSRFRLAEVWAEPRHALHAGFKKRFAHGFTLTLRVRNLVEFPNKINMENAAFDRRMRMVSTWNRRQFRIGLTWNFKTGKAFRAKQIEAGNNEEAGRL